MKKLGVINESKSEEIVSLTPKNVEQLKEVFEILIEKDAGLISAYTDAEYLAAGAKIIDNKDDLIEASDIILSFGSSINAAQYQKKKTFIGFLNTMNDNSVVAPYFNRKVDVYSLDMIPRTSLAQSMDLISSVASISGYQAVLMAAEMSPLVVPMITSAGGTLKPAKFLILGAGVAGLQAIATAKRLGARVKAFDVRKNTKTEVESLGAEFIVIEGSEESESAGGYAIEQSQVYLDEVAARLSLEASEADIIITTAKIPGKKSPVLITEETVHKMKPGSIIIDLAAENGGNCALTKKDRIQIVNGIKIVGPVSLLKNCSNSAANLISNNFAAFLNYYNKNVENEKEDEILKATKVIEDGKVIHERIISEVSNL